MNETRFIELLNLYVDQQLSAPEAAELEAEIQRNPARHRTYRQYCRMQKGCAQLFEHERSFAPASGKLSRALTEADRKILAFPATPDRGVWATRYSFAAVAAAACVAFVIVRQTNQSLAPTAPSIAIAAPAVPAVEAPVAVVAVAAPGEAGVTSGFSTEVPELRFGALAVSMSDGMFFNDRVRPEVSSSLVWMQDVQLKPIRKVSTEEFLFRTASPKVTDEALLPARGADDESAESAAFTFTK